MLLDEFGNPTDSFVWSVRQKGCHFKPKILKFCIWSNKHELREKRPYLEFSWRISPESG